MSYRLSIVELLHSKKETNRTTIWHPIHETDAMVSYIFLNFYYIYIIIKLFSIFFFNHILYDRYFSMTFDLIVI